MEDMMKRMKVEENKKQSVNAMPIPLLSKRLFASGTALTWRNPLA